MWQEEWCICCSSWVVILCTVFVQKNLKTFKKPSFFQPCSVVWWSDFWPPHEMDYTPYEVQKTVDGVSIVFDRCIVHTSMQLAEQWTPTKETDDALFFCSSWTCCMQWCRLCIWTAVKCKNAPEIKLESCSHCWRLSFDDIALLNKSS